MLTCNRIERIKQYVKGCYFISFLCRCRSAVTGGGGISTSTNEAYGVVGEAAGGIQTSTNEAYGRVIGAVAGDGGVSTSNNEAYGVVGGVAGGSGIRTSTNEAYGKVGGGEREEGYELVEISHREPSPPARLEEMYEIPIFPNQPLPTIPLPPTTGTEENTAVYDVIPGNQ